MISSDIAIDFGTSQIRIFMAGKGLVLAEPSAVVFHPERNEIVAVGKEAAQMVGRINGDLCIERPFVGGFISNYAMAEHVVTSCIKRIGVGKVFLPGATVSVPLSITEVERHAISDVIERSGIRKIQYVGKPVAAALGVGLGIKSSIGCMVVDIGAYETVVAVLAAGQVLGHKTIPVAGDAFDESIIRYLRRRRALEVGPQTGEQLKKEIGSAFPRERVTSAHGKGRNIHSGLPEDCVITSDEMIEALIDPITEISNAIEATLEGLPPEIASDISRSAIVLAGGGSRLYGMDQFLAKRLRLPVQRAENPELAVVQGAARAFGRQ